MRKYSDCKSRRLLFFKFEDLCVEMQKLQDEKLRMIFSAQSLGQLVRLRFFFPLTQLLMISCCSTTNALLDFGDYIPAGNFQSSRVSCVLMDSLKGTSIYILAEPFADENCDTDRCCQRDDSCCYSCFLNMEVTPQPSYFSHT